MSPGRLVRQALTAGLLGALAGALCAAYRRRTATAPRHGSARRTARASEPVIAHPGEIDLAFRIFATPDD
ncbi:hypothetical protein [Streptomyces avicenniae]|uniref:hypothetical protein n=1 Tax=Streptomyces avicenniae TaxID=500153 RepID=UPI00069B7411|nr:hypothetical protein [Streptomyces avicenniae]